MFSYKLWMQLETQCITVKTFSIFFWLASVVVQPSTLNMVDVAHAGQFRQ